MAKIMRQTLREQVTQAIRMKLLTGQLKPGTRIVEQEMAEELGVSRGPVREALRQIEEKQYGTEFEKRGISKIWKYGIAFCGKQVHVKMKI